ncbi:hypothetical protein DM860_001994 [Cuscuta australis]|uniref:Protein kinase domain-containing protein n=1 Tax=Cuscuta australis TaxID=267555 RepID=A0A328DZW6_9ASTE|nr:hypothetical protein DM860_001994 [Cuscuta australis]
MGDGLTVHGIQILYLIILALVFDSHGHCSLNSEGLALLKFQERVDYDPYGVFLNWNTEDCDPCMWLGVRCFDGSVQMLDFNGYALEGTLAPELGNLSHLKALVLSKNRFSGVIPPEIGQLKMLEVLDVRYNSLNGTIPAEIGGLHSLRSLLLCNNTFHGSIPLEIGKLRFLTELQFDTNLTGPVCINRKLGHGKGFLHRSSDYCFDVHSSSPCLHDMTRRMLGEQSSNLAAAPIDGGAQLGSITPQPITRSSGSFPASPEKKVKSPPQAPPPSPHPKQQDQSNHGVLPQLTGDQDSGGSENTWEYIVGAISCVAFLLILAVVVVFICRARAANTIGPWKTGLSGQLQKAFITGVPKLNRSELEAACEDFSNIICTADAHTSYKGTLSSKGESAVFSTAITSLKDWSDRAEISFRKKIDILSRINHKNFINLIGYCEEDEPFTRMMVFEYAPNGTLSEHLHDQEFEHLDWNVRMRIVMGIAYCLQHMHNLNPPLSHPNITSDTIFLTDDYASKIGEVGFWAEFTDNSKFKDSDDHSELPPLAEPEANIYSFGLVLLEIISGKLPHSEEQGSLLKWATPHLNGKKMEELIDPTLESYKDNELSVVCEVIQECTEKEARKRPTMNEVVSKLREAIDVSPAAAGPRFSPLWWAELDILSSEAP